MKTSHLPRSKNIPSVVLIKQHFSVPKEADVREATVREVKKLFPDTTAIKGKIVGLTCPSSGIRVRSRACPFERADACDAGPNSRRFILQPPRQGSLRTRHPYQDDRA